MTDDNPGDRAFAAVLAEELRGVVGQLKRRLRTQASVGDLTASQTSVLLRLERDGPQITLALARAEAIRSQSMRPIVSAL